MRGTLAAVGPILLGLSALATPSCKVGDTDRPWDAHIVPEVGHVDQLVVPPADGTADTQPADTGSADTGPFVLEGLTISGDPRAENGATWTYKATVDDVVYDLAGVLRQPQGQPADEAGYPAVVLNHAYNNSAESIQSKMGALMASWGLVVIAVNFTHADSAIPSGSPGVRGADNGASTANILRARKCLDVLASLGYVNMTRVGAHGHSMGAFVTIGLTGTYPTRFIVASHTAGGVDDALHTPFATTEQAEGITVPYQMHHGDADTTVPLSAGERLREILTGNGVQNELWIYEGLGHNIAFKDENNTRIESWYRSHGLI